MGLPDEHDVALGIGDALNGRVPENNEDSGGPQTGMKPRKLRIVPPTRLLVVGPMALHPQKAGSEGSGGPPKKRCHSLSLSNDGSLSFAAVLTA